MISETDIANQALIAVGQMTIASLDDNVLAARLCRRLYPQRRDELLRQFDWNFARATASLAALADAPEFGPANAFQLPADCLRMLATDQDDPDDPLSVAWEVQGQRILTDLAAPLNITYTRQETRAGMMDPLFVTALGLRIARDLALPLANSTALRQEMAAEFQQQIQLGRGAAYRERFRQEPEYTWLRMRH